MSDLKKIKSNLHDLNLRSLASNRELVKLSEEKIKYYTEEYTEEDKQTRINCWKTIKNMANNMVEELLQDIESYHE